MIDVLVVEDEPNYSDTLEMFIEELGYRVSGVADEGEKALKHYLQHNPDLVLMDINLKGKMNGIDLSRQLQQIKRVPVIFITSFNDADTFEAARDTVPFAYLTKPFEPEQLQRCMELAIQNAFAGGRDLRQKEAALAPDHVFVKDRSRLIKLKLDDILWIEVEDKYCMLHTTNRKLLLRQSLKELATKLDESVFVKTHRSVMVNMNHVDDIDTALSVVNVKDNELPLGKTYRDELIERLNLL